MFNRIQDTSATVSSSFAFSMFHLILHILFICKFFQKKKKNSVKHRNLKKL